MSFLKFELVLMFFSSFFLSFFFLSPLLANRWDVAEELQIMDLAEAL